jgi:flagellar motor switch protein FliN/FliY
LPLDRRIEDPVALYVGERMIAEGELVELEGERAGQLAVRVTRLTEAGHGAL